MSSATEKTASPFRALRITEHALKKARRYARLVVDEFGSAECLGFLLAAPGSTVVDDVSLAPEQQASPQSVAVSGEAVLRAGREIEAAGKRAVGWWHSHGTFDPFHSGTDTSSATEVLVQLAASNVHRSSEEIQPSLAADGAMVFERGFETLRLTLDDAAAPPVRLRLFRRVEVGFAFSLVVNARGDEPYAEVYTLCWSGGERLQRQRVTVEVVRAIDEDELRRQIAERVRFTGQTEAHSRLWAFRRSSAEAS